METDLIAVFIGTESGTYEKDGSITEWSRCMFVDPASQDVRPFPVKFPSDYKKDFIVGKTYKLKVYFSYRFSKWSCNALVDTGGE